MGQNPSLAFPAKNASFCGLIPGMTSQYQIRVCQNSACGLRYPLVNGHPFGERCPICLGETISALTRPLSPEPFSPPNQPQFQMEALLDNIRSAWNVGAIFRTADGFGVQKLYLCGITPTPENVAVGKTALGADQSIPWTYERNALSTAEKLRKDGIRLWALEQDERAAPVTASWQANDQPVVLIVGNEVTGVDPALLDLCEQIVYIPMQGKKRSLNVEVAFGVAVSALGNAYRR
jgi:23S rRNA (guanosine2251-2'-O)-methyltransferase